MDSASRVVITHVEGRWDMERSHMIRGHTPERNRRSFCFPVTGVASIFSSKPESLDMRLDFTSTLSIGIWTLYPRNLIGLLLMNGTSWPCRVRDGLPVDDLIPSEKHFWNLGSHATPQQPPLNLFQQFLTG